MVTHDSCPTKRHRLLKNAAIGSLGIALVFSPIRSASSDDFWEEAKAYSAALKDAADEAATLVAAATAAVAAAARDLANAKSAFTTANNAAATTAATLAAVAQAEAAVAAATATLAAAKTVAVGAAAAAATAAAGTLVGQGLDWAIHFCWDPVCGATSLTPGASAIFDPPTAEEIEVLIPALVDVGSSFEFTEEELAALDPVARDFMVQGTQLFIDTVQGAAASTADRFDEVLEAVEAMTPLLSTYRQTTELFAQTLESTATVSPVPELQQALQDLSEAGAQVLAVCDPAGGDDCAALADSFAAMTVSLQQIIDAVSAVSFGPLVGGPDAIFDSLALPDLEQFVIDTQTLGATALPEHEIDLMHALLDLARVFFPGEDVGELIANYEGTGGIGNAGVLFDAATGQATLVEILRGTATMLSPTGSWLDIDLEQSPVTQEARQALPEPSTLGTFLVGVGFCGAFWAARQAARCRVKGNRI